MSRESLIEGYSNFLGILAIGGSLYAVVAVILFFVKGMDWFGTTILPLHNLAFVVAILLTFLVLIPLMVIRSTRGFAGMTLYALSYLFGGITWFYTAFYCLYLGVFWLIVGVFLLGVGVAPVAFIGSMVKGDWSIFGIILLQVVVTMGTRGLSAYALTTADSD